MRRFRWSSYIHVGTACCAISGGVWASNSQPTLHQLNHRVFTAAEGAPSDIYALAQTTDGTLWIGGGNGLTRFDGVRFVPYPDSSEDPLVSSSVASLLATPDGGLWIGFRPGGASLLKDGHVTTYGEDEGLPVGSVAQFALDRDGSVWAAARKGVFHLKGKRWEQLDDPTLGTPYGVSLDSEGALWVATMSGLFVRAAGEQQFRAVNHEEYFSPAGTALVVTARGEVWAAARRAITHIDSPRSALRASTLAGISNDGGPILLDDFHNLWTWDDASHSLIRKPVGRNPQITQDDAPAEQFSLADGLNARRVFSLLQDRERNIWIGTNTGLQRFSPSNIARDSVPQCGQQPLSPNNPLVAGESGSLWMACDDARGTFVEQIVAGAVAYHQATPVFDVAYRDVRGEIWFGGPTALGHIEAGRMVETPLPSSLQGRPMQVLVRNNADTWMSVSRRFTYRLNDGVLLENGNLPELPHACALAGTATAAGTVWLGYTNSRVARVIGATVTMFGPADGLQLGNVLSIYAEETHVWVGGDWGLTFFNGKGFTKVRTASGATLKGVSGIVRARNGDLWLNGTSGIAHISQSEVDWALRDPSHPVAFETFNYQDGVPGTAAHLRSSAIETTDGRLWFVMTEGIISIDANHLVRNPLPPPVTIWAISSARKRYTNLNAGLKLPVHTSDIQIEYSAGSLTVPERVRFRYKLEGSDIDWQDVGGRREAHYTNLHAGRYMFRVIASNNDGVWNNIGASFGFSILPAFYETAWFYALCAMAFILFLAGLYRVRVRRIAAQIRSRLEARLAERERIARELHDTLLQGMQGLIWRFQAAADRLEPDQAARKLLEQALDRADRLLGESRDRVKDMRPSASAVTELPQALIAEGEQLAGRHGAAFRVSTEGARRELHPIVREECFLIAREALANAFQHAEAKTVEVEVVYSDTALQVRIRDDGHGIGVAVLQAGGRPGHYGLIGMRERAKKLGAQLDFWSRTGAGTEIDLKVPAGVAYKHSRRPSRISSRFRKMRVSARRERRLQ